MPGTREPTTDEVAETVSNHYDDDGFHAASPRTTDAVSVQLHHVDGFSDVVAELSEQQFSFTVSQYPESPPKIVVDRVCCYDDAGPAVVE